MKREAKDVIKAEVELIIKQPIEFQFLFDSIKNYAKKFNYFENTTDAVKEIIFNNDIKFTTALRFINILSFLDVLKRKSLSDKKLYISPELELFDKLDDFIDFYKKDVSLKGYGRIKKIKSINGNINSSS